VSALLAVDPGIRGCGVALFRDGELRAAAYVRNAVRKGNDFDAVLSLARSVRAWVFPADPYFGSDGDRAVLEYPQVYTASKSKGDNNDLLPLAAVDGAIVALLPGLPGVSATRVLPRDWKHTMAHEAVEARVLGRLSPSERAVLDEALKDARSLGHNVIDAVGIGLHALGRFAPRKVIAR